MKRMILTGVVALAAGVASLMAQAGGKAPQPKSKGELETLQAMFSAQQANNFDGVIKAADELVTKFADTDFKETALYMEADAYHMKKDDTKAQIYAEQALQANPKSYQASIMLAEMIAKSTRESDLDREEKLGKAEKYAKDAIDFSKD